MSPASIGALVVLLESPLGANDAISRMGAAHGLALHLMWGHEPLAMPNKDQTKGQWEQVKGKAKRVWGELTDDDMLKAEGSMDKLYGIIQKRFGDTKESIKKKLDETSMG